VAGCCLRLAGFLQTGHSKVAFRFFLLGFSTLPTSPGPGVSPTRVPRVSPFFLAFFAPLHQRVSAHFKSLPTRFPMQSPPAVSPPFLDERDDGLMLRHLVSRGGPFFRFHHSRASLFFCSHCWLLLRDWPFFRFPLAVLQPLDYLPSFTFGFPRIPLSTLVFFFINGIICARLSPGCAP